MANKENILPHSVFARKGRKNHEPVKEDPRLTLGNVEPFAVQEGKTNPYGVKGPAGESELVLIQQSAEKPQEESASPLPEHFIKKEIRTIAKGKPIYLEGGQKFFTTSPIQAQLIAENAWTEPEDGVLLSRMTLLDAHATLYVNGKYQDLFRGDAFYTYAQRKGKRRNSSSR